MSIIHENPAPSNTLANEHIRMACRSNEACNRGFCDGRHIADYTLRSKGVQGVALVQSWQPRVNNLFIGNFYKPLFGHPLNHGIDFAGLQYVAGIEMRDVVAQRPH